VWHFSTTQHKAFDQPWRIGPLRNGGIFKPNRMWSAVVDRDGRLCSIINTDATNGDGIAIRAAAAITGSGHALLYRAEHGGAAAGAIGA